MRSFPNTKGTPLVRTDFSDDAAWTALRAAVEEPQGDFRAHVTPIDDRAFDGVTVEVLVTAASGGDHLLALVADTRSLRDPEHPILVVALGQEPGRNFRVIASHAWSVENNLSLANMEFEEFQDAVDADGVFRGFDQSSDTS